MIDKLAKEIKDRLIVLYYDLEHMSYREIRKEIGIIEQLVRKLEEDSKDAKSTI